jgi:hypothetical protein
LGIRLRKNDVILKNKFILENTGEKVEVAKNYYNFFLVVNYLMEKIDNSFDIISKLDNLFLKYSNVNKQIM